MLAGKVMMDRNAPDYLLDTPESAYQDSRALLEKWHHVDRLQYAITPRFAPTSTEAQLEQAARLAQEFPDAYVHSHVADNKNEVAWVAELFPWSRSYLDVYDRYGLLRVRSVFAHCIHLDENDRRRMAVARDIEEKLFVLMMLGDDRAISATYIATYIMGACEHLRGETVRTGDSAGAIESNK